MSGGLGPAVGERNATKPRVGVSACLVGERVRYDGEHKLQAALAEDFGEKVEWVPVCPEVELGLGVPREPVQLEAHEGGVRLVAAETRRDLTASMREWASSRAEELAEDGLDGYIFKARSPSCGLGSTRVGGNEETRDGLFAAAVRERLPLLPIADEEETAAARGRRRFLRLARAHRDLRLLFCADWTRGVAVEFHSRRKLLLLAHCPQAYTELGRLVATELASEGFQGDYAREYLAAMGEGPTPGRHANALAHAAGFVSRELAPAARAALASSIEQIGGGDLARLDDVRGQILAYAREQGQAYLLAQLYLTSCEPY